MYKVISESDRNMQQPSSPLSHPLRQKMNADPAFRETLEMVHDFLDYY